jgi:hypothetical protein
LQAARAREELIFKRSTNAEGVTSFIYREELGSSALILDVSMTEEGIVVTEFETFTTLIDVAVKL